MEMKTIVCRGGVLRFRIPDSSKEEYSDTEDGAFYEYLPDSGTLRVKVITAECRDEGRAAIKNILKPLLLHFGKSDEHVDRIGENELARYEDHVKERGTRLRIFYWVFANPIPPRSARVVTFSYTVLDSLAETEQVKSELDMLESEIVRTEFAPGIGILPRGR